jgi:hypothetical protein
MAAAACPSYGEMLAALESEFRPVDRDGLDGALDERSLPLFGLVATPLEERAIALGRAAQAMADEGEAPAAWLLESALKNGCVAVPVRAALAAEIGRRAGVPAHPARLRGCWAIHVRGESGGIGVDLGADASGAPPGGPLGCLCAHQLAFVVLRSLVDAWESAGNWARARHTRVLRAALSRGDAA